MPVFNTKALIEELYKNVQDVVSLTKELAVLDDGILNKQPEAGKWSIAQVIEHLNSYNRYYLPEMKMALAKGVNSGVRFNAQYKSGWFGDYFTKMMQPKEDGKIANKMNSPKDHRPIAELDARKVMAEFIEKETDLLHYLQQALNTNMGKLRVPISISKFIKLKLGDTFRFLIAHQQRHFVQINNILPLVKQQSASSSAA